MIFLSYFLIVFFYYNVIYNINYIIDFQYKKNRRIIIPMGEIHYVFIVF